MIKNYNLKNSLSPNKKKLLFNFSKSNNKKNYANIINNADNNLINLPNIKNINSNINSSYQLNKTKINLQKMYSNINNNNNNNNNK